MQINQELRQLAVDTPLCGETVVVAQERQAPPVRIQPVHPEAVGGAALRGEIAVIKLPAQLRHALLQPLVFGQLAGLAEVVDLGVAGLAAQGGQLHRR